MGEPKPLASLNAGLLARKGAARPAMRRQPLGSGPAPLGTGGYDDLGWNDMGYDVDPEQSSEPTRMLDLKPLLTASVPAHNAEAEHAVDYQDDGEFEVQPEAHADAEPLEHLAVFAPAVFAEPESAPVPAPEHVNPPKPVVVRQQEELKDRVAEVARTVAASPPPARRKPRAMPARDKAAFTLRLDAERHLRLRLASAINNRSAQLILTELLDEYLAALPEIEAMASRLPAAKKARLTAQQGGM